MDERRKVARVNLAIATDVTAQRLYRCARDVGQPTAEDHDYNEASNRTNR